MFGNSWGETRIYQFITNNQSSFQLRWKENLVKHQKVSEYYENDCSFLRTPDTVVQRCSAEKMFLEILLNSQENTSARVLKKRLWHRCFLVNFTKFLRTPFFTEPLRWLAPTSPGVHYDFPAILIITFYFQCISSFNNYVCSLLFAACPGWLFVMALTRVFWD